MRTGASREEVRRAYRDLARRLHPDRHAQASAAEKALADRRMREVNGAWEVLNDDDRRRRYDESLRRQASPATGSRAGASPGTPAARAAPGAAPVSTPSSVDADLVDDDLVDVMGEVGPFGSLLMRHLPWLVAAAVLVGILVVSAYATATRNSSDPAGVRTPAQSVGSCVVVTPGPVTRLAACTAPGALRLVARVPASASCPGGAEPRRLDTGGFTDCLAPATSGSPISLPPPSRPSAP